MISLEEAMAIVGCSTVAVAVLGCVEWTGERALYDQGFLKNIFWATNGKLWCRLLLYHAASQISDANMRRAPHA